MKAAFYRVYNRHSSYIYHDIELAMKAVSIVLARDPHYLSLHKIGGVDMHISSHILLIHDRRDK